MSDTSCVRNCCRCLASIPCSALTCWLLTTISVVTWGGALMVAFRRTTQLLDVNTDFIPADAICLGVMFGMVGLMLLFLIAATFTSQPMNSNFLGSTKQTRCVQTWLVFKMMLLLLLALGWVGVCLVHAFSLTAFTSVYVSHYRGDSCVDLKPFLLTRSKWEICGQDFKNFYKKSEATFECYIISTVGAIMTVISLVFYLMYTAANFVLIKELRSSDNNAYKNDLHGNKGHHGGSIDTRM